ncbi:MAG: MFS transporter [Spirochaetaceae bacterium]|nr:MAG: MFS transporter [Spirochaetaceae bacterium]
MLHKKPPKKAEGKIKRSLRYSLYDGITYSVMFGASDPFYQTYGMYVGAGTILLGLMRSLPSALGSLSQLFARQGIMLFGGRRKFVATNALLHGMMFLPILAAPFLGQTSGIWLLASLCLAGIFGMILVPAWNSWMGDLVSAKSRGHYFGVRSGVTGIISFFALLAAGWVLHLFEPTARNAETHNSQYMGFLIIFSVAFIARGFSAFFLNKKHEPKYRYTHNKLMPLALLATGKKNSQIRILIIFLSLMNFASMLVAPYVDVYYRNAAGMNYLIFTGVSGMFFAFKYFAMPVWGKACDRYGTRKVLVVSGMMVAILPFFLPLAMFHPAAFITQGIAGFAWGGFEIAAFNILFDSTKPAERTSIIAYYNIVNGAAGLMATMAGWLILEYNNLFATPFILLFITSGILRIIISLFFAKRIQETREVEHIHARLLPFRMLQALTEQTLSVGYSVVSLGKKLIFRNGTGSRRKGK